MLMKTNGARELLLSLFSLLEFCPSIISRAWSRD